MHRKSEVNWSFTKFATSFLPWDQCDKACNFVQGKAFEVHHEIPILGVEL